MWAAGTGPGSVGSPSVCSLRDGSGGWHLPPGGAIDAEDRPVDPNAALPLDRCWGHPYDTQYHYHGPSQTCFGSKPPRTPVPFPALTARGIRHRRLRDLRAARRGRKDRQEQGSGRLPRSHTRDHVGRQEGRHVPLPPRRRVSVLHRMFPGEAGDGARGRARLAPGCVQKWIWMCQDPLRARCVAAGGRARRSWV